ncbi:MAG TPA: ankyrin repeat domain-containing protein [Thermoanaerobaculia bacterium]|nr:ankyrin repeat domain-containing protein [Thermoanaerobaculia bacterium]
MSKEHELIEAIRSGDAARTAALLDEDPALLDARHGDASALLLAVYTGKPQIGRLFAERGKKLTFHEACALGERETVRRMVEADPSLLHQYSSDGYAPLGFATFFGHSDVDRFLLEQGAEVNAPARNPQRVSAVHAAAAVCDHSMLALLLEHGADPNAQQQMDYTPMHTAASRGDFDVARLLLRYGADPHAPGSDGKTPATVARDHQQDAFAEWIESLPAATT